jgi:hypothetical protein
MSKELSKVGDQITVVDSDVAEMKVTLHLMDGWLSVTAERPHHIFQVPVRAPALMQASPEESTLRRIADLEKAVKANAEMCDARSTWAHEANTQLMAKINALQPEASAEDQEWTCTACYGRGDARGENDEGWECSVCDGTGEQEPEPEPITARGPKAHSLKTLRPFFEAIKLREKTFEIRKNDRDYRVGDTLILCEWTGEAYTGRMLDTEVTYITDYDQQPGYVVMGLRLLERGVDDQEAWEVIAERACDEYFEQPIWHALSSAGKDSWRQVARAVVAEAVRRDIVVSHPQLKRERENVAAITREKTIGEFKQAPSQHVPPEDQPAMNADEAADLPSLTWGHLTAAHNAFKAHRQQYPDENAEWGAMGTAILAARRYERNRKTSDYPIPAVFAGPFRNRKEPTE